MKCVIITKNEVIDLGERCLSKLRDFVNDEFFLTFNEVKRLRTLFFLACQKVFFEHQKHNLVKEVWNEKLEKKFHEALMITKESKIVNDNSKVEEIFKTPLNDKYSREKFSLENTIRIFDLIKEGLDKCIELNDDLRYEIKDFNCIYQVYNFIY